MIHRYNSNRSSQRKSTSSTHSKHESMDPEVARHHAHIAATLAFTRAQERSTAGVGLSTAALARHPLNQQQERPDIAIPATTDDRTIRRQQSVRFAGPHTVPRSNAIAAPKHPQVVTQPTSANLRPIALTTNTPVPAMYRPPSRSSSIGKGSISKATAQNLSLVNGVFDEYYTREDDIASTPSSYRRIRRSKSMFSPIKAPSIFYTNGTPDKPDSHLVRKHSFLSSHRSQDQGLVALRSPKSMSLLQEGHGRKETGFQERNDAAVQMARDRFFAQTTQQRLREQPSFLFRSKAQRQEKYFRKSVRSSSANSYGAPVCSKENEPPMKDLGLKDVARKASKSLRSKLKRVFGRSRDEPVQIPNQQAVAKETHVRRYLGDLPVYHDQNSNIPRPTDASLSRVSTRVPSLHNAASNQQLRSQAGSVRSERSVKSLATDHSEDKSRVTSWNSTGVNTVTSQTARVQAERELQQRLSIIKENGTHVSSSSFKRPSLQNQFSAYPLIQHKIAEPGHVRPPNSGPVDSARVYSALMKRLDGHHATSDHEPTEEYYVINPGQPHMLPCNSKKIAHKSRSQATIRCVSVEESIESCSSSNYDCPVARKDQNKFERTGGHVHQWEATASLPEARTRYMDNVFSSELNSSKKENVRLTSSGNGETHPSGLPRRASPKTLYYMPENKCFSPEKTAHRNESTLPGARALRDSRSTFFGGTAAFTVSRTPSPFRRALAEAEINSGPSNTQQYAPRRFSPLRNPLFCSDASSNGGNMVVTEVPEVAYSESVYSRTTSGRPPRIDVSPIILNFNEQEASPQTSTGGEVVIIDRTTYRPIIPVCNENKASGSTGSVEWQKWMSSEVEKLERAKENSSTTLYVNYAHPTMPKSFNSGHIRENAQIDDDGTEVAQSKVLSSKQTMEIIQQNSNLPPTAYVRPILRNRSASSLVEQLTGNHKSSIVYPPFPPPTPSLPPAVARLSLRSIQSKSSIRSVKAINSAGIASAQSSAVKISSLSGRHVLHKRDNSISALRSKNSLEIPEKSVKRSSQLLSKSPQNRSPIFSLSLQQDSQFRRNSSRARSPARSSEENFKRHDGSDEVYQSDGAGLVGPEMNSGIDELSEREAQSLGSKRMVDLFLSSRRKRIASTSEDGDAHVFL